MTRILIVLTLLTIFMLVKIIVSDTQEGIKNTVVMGNQEQIIREVIRDELGDFEERLDEVYERLDEVDENALKGYCRTVDPKINERVYEDETADQRKERLKEEKLERVKTAFCKKKAALYGWEQQEWKYTDEDRQSALAERKSKLAQRKSSKSSSSTSNEVVAGETNGDCTYKKNGPRHNEWKGSWKKTTEVLRRCGNSLKLV